jgi:hypothetical protein
VTITLELFTFAAEEERECKCLTGREAENMRKDMQLLSTFVTLLFLERKRIITTTFLSFPTVTSLVFCSSFEARASRRQTGNATNKRTRPQNEIKKVNKFNKFNQKIQFFSHLKSFFSFDFCVSFSQTIITFQMQNGNSFH